MELSRESQVLVLSEALWYVSAATFHEKGEESGVISGGENFLSFGPMIKIVVAGDMW